MGNRRAPARWHEAPGAWENDPIPAELRATTRCPMKRTIYNEDHEAFRSSVREFVAREVEPNLEKHLEQKELGREFWLAAGNAGLLGLEVPEEYGGMEAGDYRFNAV